MNLHRIGRLAISSLVCVIFSWTAAISTGQTTAPTTAPAYHPVIGLANVGGFNVVRLPDQAGGVMHVDACDKAGKPIADPTLTYSWDFGDPTGIYNIIPAGWNAAHLYNGAGNYVVTFTVHDKSTQLTRIWTKTVTIKPDTRRVVHAKSAADVINGVKGGNVRVLVNAASVYLFKPGTAGAPPIDIQHTRNVTVETEGAGQAKFLLGMNGSLFASWSDTQNLLIRNIRFEGDVSILNTYNDHKYSGAWMGWIRGTNSAIVGCTFQYVMEGMQTQPGCRFQFFANNSSVDAFSIWNTFLWSEGTNVVCLGGECKGSPFENPMRFAATGVERGLVAYTIITEPPYSTPPYQHKATFTFRTVKDLYVYKLQSKDSWLGYEPRADTNACINNVVDSCTFNNSVLVFRATVTGAVVKNNIFNQYHGGPALSVDFVRGPTIVTGVDVFNNTFNLTQARPALGYTAADPKNPKDPTKYGVPLTAYTEHNNDYKIIPLRPAEPFLK